MCAMQHGSIDHVGYMILPKRLRLSVETIEVEGAYLLSDGACLFLWIQRDVSPDFLYKVYEIEILRNPLWHCGIF